MATTCALLPAVGALAVAGCGDDDIESGPVTSLSAVHADRCLVRLHGRSDTGSPTVMGDGYAELAPDGNGEFDGGRQWLYATDDEYAAARDVVGAAIAEVGCERVVLNGFSNGAAFAAKLYCRGETFDGTVVGVVVDDPVPDEAAAGCEPAPGIDVALYWTGALTEATPGASCDDLGWTCEGDTLVGVEGYAEGLGASIQDSPHDEHTWYRDAPELTAWLESSV
ncbi:MAG: hypothetical protein ACRD0G_14700 [Acidimicrobiales bacterium]